MRKHTALLIAGMIGLSACEQSPPAEGLIPARRQITADSRTFADRQFVVYDPAESVNRQVYKFNAELDEYFLIPVVEAYKYIAPEFVRNRVQDFFLNVGEVTNFTNAVFQIAPEKAGTTLGRFVVNTTAGLLGTFDVATEWGLKRQPEDFGKTLGHWGAGSGAYVVLPLLGPSNVRDTIGQVVDYATLAVIIPHDVKETVAYDVVAYGLEPINLRYSNSFRYYASGSPFEYDIVRYVATQARTAEIEKEKHPDLKVK